MAFFGAIRPRMSYGRTMTWIDSPARRVGLALSLAWIGGCYVDDADSGYMDDQPPNGVCETDGDDPDCLTTGADSTSGTSSGTDGGGTGTTDATTGASGGVDGDQCQASADCPDGELCVADFIVDKRGPYQCVGMCLEEMDEAKWCADAAACCNAGAACTDRGFCVGGDDGGTGTGTSG